MMKTPCVGLICDGTLKHLREEIKNLTTRASGVFDMVRRCASEPHCHLRVVVNDTNPVVGG